MFNFHYKINCCQSCSYQMNMLMLMQLTMSVFMKPTQGPCIGYYNFACVLHTFVGLTPPDPLISHTAFTD